MHSKKEKVSSVPGSSVSGRYRDLYAPGIIGLYCIIYFLFRLLVSSSMEMSEAEQFLNASTFSFGYSQQAPLYSWLVMASSMLFGLNFVTIAAVKYLLLFLFFLVFYLLANEFWDSGKALIITGSLLLFPTYSYEIHRDLTHTILVSLMSVTTCYLYIRMTRGRNTAHYLLAGALIGLGMLSKYNFIFFLAALFLSSLFSEEGRRVIFDKRILLTLFCSLLVLLPHLVWLAREHFPSIHYAFTRAKAGKLAFQPLSRTLSIILFSYSEVLLFLLVSVIVFRRYLSCRGKGIDRMLRQFRLLALNAILIPLLVIVFLGAGNFTCRWLAPGLFALPFAIFSFVDMYRPKRELKLLGSVCIAIAVSVLMIRGIVGFLPDVTGKVERIHIPFDALSQQVIDKLATGGIGDLHSVAVITDESQSFIAANIMARIRGARYVSMEDVLNNRSVRRDIGQTGGIVLYDAANGGVPKDVRNFIASDPIDRSAVHLTAPYLHSTNFAPYVLGAVVIRTVSNK